MFFFQVNRVANVAFVFCSRHHCNFDKQKPCFCTSKRVPTTPQQIVKEISFRKSWKYFKTSHKPRRGDLFSMLVVGTLPYVTRKMKIFDLPFPHPLRNTLLSSTALEYRTTRPWHPPPAHWSCYVIYGRPLRGHPEMFLGCGVGAGQMYATVDGVTLWMMYYMLFSLRATPVHRAAGMGSLEAMQLL